MSEISKPKFPLCSYISEGDIFEKCPSCGSTMKRKFQWCFKLKVLGCVHPECENYYAKNKI